MPAVFKTRRIGMIFLKKKIFAAAVVVMVTAGITGCGGSDNENKKEDTGVSQRIELPEIPIE